LSSIHAPFDQRSKDRRKRGSLSHSEQADLKVGPYELLRYLIPRINMPSHADARVIREHPLNAGVPHLTGGRV